MYLGNVSVSSFEHNISCIFSIDRAQSLPSGVERFFSLFDYDIGFGTKYMYIRFQEKSQ